MTPSRIRAEGNRLVTSTGPRVLRGVNIADPWRIREERKQITSGVEITLETVIFYATARPVRDAAGELTAAIDNGGFGSNVIRLPVHPDRFLPDKDGYVEKYLDPAINACTEGEAYAIIDCHYVAHDVDDYLVRKPQVEEFWSDMAKRYANNENVIYEIFNEPVEPRGWSRFKKELAQPIIDLIRVDAPDTLLLVGAPYYNEDVGDAVHDPLDDRNVAYVSHCYPEFFPLLTTRLLPLIKEYPVFVTEWGYEQGSNSWSPATTAEFGAPWLQFMEDNGLSWTAWILDPLWDPRIVNYDWSPTAGPGRIGELLLHRLAELNDRLPPPAG